MPQIMQFQGEVGVFFVTFLLLFFKMIELEDNTFDFHWMIFKKALSNCLQHIRCPDIIQKI